jgi:hypothetical protein
MGLVAAQRKQLCGISRTEKTLLPSFDSVTEEVVAMVLNQ